MIINGLLHQRQALAKGAKFLTIESILKQSERESIAAADGSILDVEALNKDITRSILRVLEQENSKRAPNDKIRASFSRFKLSAPDLAKALATRPPCRFQVIEKNVSSSSGTEEPVTVVLDIAHNEAAIVAFAAKVKSTYPGKTVR
jgi:folylpolyglutamate synthase/dihydropteroate synthase